MSPMIAWSQAREWATRPAGRGNSRGPGRRRVTRVQRRAG